jgi:hypothetical protein
MIVSRKEAGREEGEIASKTPPHGSVEADIHVGKTPFDQRGPGTSWACLMLAIMAIA